MKKHKIFLASSSELKAVTAFSIDSNFKIIIMEEVLIKNKEKYLKEHYPFDETPKLTDKKRCIHCDTIFTVSEYKVFRDKKGNEYICCPNAPDCDGTVIDWFRIDNF